MDFIFMMTRADRTVADALDVVEDVIAAGVRHIGFKDIGVDAADLPLLVSRIREAGATSYIEVVSTTPQDCLRSARVARDVGVDCLLGGTQVEDIQALLAGTAVRYFPFPGRPTGHPTALGGSPAQIAEDCRRFMDNGCAGVDLLAYRATDADPLDLVRAAREGVGEGRLIVAGSIDSSEKIEALRRAGVDGFTIGSALLDGSMFPRLGSLRSKLRAVQAIADADLVTDPA